MNNYSHDNNFRWNLYNNPKKYHQITYSVNSDDTATTSSISSDYPTLTSWHAIRTGSMNNDSLKFHRSFKSVNSEQNHPFYIYDNFSDSSRCDSLTSKVKLDRPITSLKTKHIDQCLQTSNIYHKTINYSKSIQNPFCLKFGYSLPNLDFLIQYSNAEKECTIKEIDDNDIVSSSICSSISSSGYHSNCSTNQVRPMQTIVSSYRLKSCLKRQKIKPISNVIVTYFAGDLFTLCIRSVKHKFEKSEHRRCSIPLNLFSDHSCQTKKCVSFSDEIVQYRITSSSSPNYEYQIPRDSLMDSPPNEFNLSDENENRLKNFIENIPKNLIKPQPIKYSDDKYLIDLFSNTVLHILEIKCNDSQSFYLNNQASPELDRILRQDLCSLLREILEDGFRSYSNSLWSRKMNLWDLIELATTSTSRFNDAKLRVQTSLTLLTIDWTEKFNSFIYHLLNFHQLSSWLANFVSNRTILKTYYESWSFIVASKNQNLIENITNQLEKLSPLSFRLKYTVLSNSKKAFLTKKIHLRTWLRARKNEAKFLPSNIPLSK